MVMITRSHGMTREATDENLKDQLIQKIQS